MVNRRDILITVAQGIETKIQRKLAVYEMAALGLVIQQKAQPGVEISPDMFFGITPSDTPADVAWKVHGKVQEVVLAEVMRRKQVGESTQLTESATSVMHIASETAYQKGEVCQIGTLPIEWVASDLQEPIRMAMIS